MQRHFKRLDLSGSALLLSNVVFGGFFAGHCLSYKYLILADNSRIFLNFYELTFDLQNPDFEAQILGTDTDDATISVFYKSAHKAKSCLMSAVFDVLVPGPTLMSTLTHVNPFRCIKMTVSTADEKGTGPGAHLVMRWREQMNLSGRGTFVPESYRTASLDDTIKSQNFVHAALNI